MARVVAEAVCGAPAQLKASTAEEGAAQQDDKDIGLGSASEWEVLSPLFVHAVVPGDYRITSHTVVHMCRLYNLHSRVHSAWHIAHYMRQHAGDYIAAETCLAFSVFWAA